jgi:hypothetical protein
MTNNEVVEAVSGDIQTIISNMAIKDEHRDDLFQEIVIILLQYDNKKLVDIYNKNQLRFFAARIICNQYYSVHSAFYKTYKKYEDSKYNLTDFGNEGRNDEEEAN